MILNGTELVERLMVCGYPEEAAVDICRKYASAGDFSGLEAFVRSNELLYDDRKQYV